ncbi:hypothetical protein LXL04_003769 [Taraxacum kok-saghyz]
MGEELCYDPGWTNSEGPNRKVRVSPTTCLRGIVQGDTVGVYWAARPYDSGLRSWSNPGRNNNHLTIVVTTRVGPTPKARIVRSSSPIHPNHIALDNTAEAGCCSPCDWLLKGEVSGSSLKNNLPPRVRSQVRVSPTICLRGIVQGDMVGVYWAARPYDAGPSELVQPGSFLLRPGLDQLRRPDIVRSSSPIHPNHIALDKTAEAGCWVRSQVRVSPTTCLRGIVQGDMVGVYWAARPYDAGPSELVQPGSVRSQVRVSPTTCLRGIVQGDMVGVYWAARPYDSGLRSWSNPGRNKLPNPL